MNHLLYVIMKSYLHILIIVFYEYPKDYPNYEYPKDYPNYLIIILNYFNTLSSLIISILKTFKNILLFKDLMIDNILIFCIIMLINI
jgi:hypothetical protein